MGKGNGMHEVDIVRFFETGPIEKAEVVFNIVREKMRERLRTRGPEGRESSPREASRKGSVRTKAEDGTPGAPAQ
jgi:hypothetical protein